MPGSSYAYVLLGLECKLCRLVSERILRQITGWIAERPGSGRSFRPEYLTQTAPRLEAN